MLAPMRVEDLRARLEGHEAFTVGVEEELMILDPATLDLAPGNTELLAAFDGDPRFKQELPAAQIEIAAPPAPDVPAAAASLAQARADLVAAAAGRWRFAAAGVHPFAAAEGELNAGSAYDHTLREYGPVARRQLVFGLHVHVAVPGGAETVLAVYNRMRGFLPELAALAANGAFYAGADSGLASMRPVLSGMLPRQGVPPALSTVDALADALAWGAAAGVLPTSGQWWWELRLHPEHGTLEVRVPDAQAEVADAAAVAAVVQALAAALALGDLDAPVADTWRIQENRWAACRHGAAGVMADLVTGERRPSAARLEALMDALAPVAERLGGGAELRRARALIAGGGAARQREAAAAGGAHAVAADLAARFTA